MNRFILLLLLCAACSGNGDDDPNLPPKSPPPSKPAEAPCPAAQQQFVCATPGQSCWFPRDKTSQTLCTCESDGNLQCGVVG